MHTSPLFLLITSIQADFNSMYKSPYLFVHLFIFFFACLIKKKSFEIMKKTVRGNVAMNGIIREDWRPDRS